MNKNLPVLKCTQCDTICNVVQDANITNKYYIECHCCGYSGHNCVTDFTQDIINGLKELRDSLD